MSNLKRTTVLVLGSTGQIGNLVVNNLNKNEDIQVRITSRRKQDVERLMSEGKNAVYLDLDDPTSFGTAMAGVDRLFLCTGYTVAMLSQSKTIVDAARKAGVQHIVHLGIFGAWDCTDPHFVWHQMIEAYIKVSGIQWTNLHPNMFMENLLTFFAPKGDIFKTFWGNQRMGFIAGQDIADVAAAVLTQGPDKHGSQDYWMSTEALDGPEVASVLSEVTGRKITSEILYPDDFKELFTSDAIKVEQWYAEGGIEFVRQVSNGQMGYIGMVRDGVPYITGKPALTLKEWATINADQLIEEAKK